MEIHVGGDGHGATRATEGQVQREKETGDRNGQRALLACGMPEDVDKERRPPNRPRALNARGHQGGEGGGGPLNQQRAPSTRIKVMEGDTQTRKCAPLACNQGMEEAGGSPTQ